MTRANIALITAAFAVTACNSSPGATTGLSTGEGTDALVIAQLAAVGAQCTPQLPRPAVDACDGKTLADSCTVTHEERTRTGTCQQPSGTTLTCVLAPPAPPKVAVDACAANAMGDACSFTWEHGETVNGACTAAADGTLVCAPACHH